MTITGVNTKVVFGGRVVNLNGTTTWSGNTAANNNAIQFWNGGTINNNATFNDANAFASFIEHNVGGPHNFNNIGIYNKTSQHGDDGRPRRGLQQLGNAQHRRRNDALRLRHAGADRHGQRRRGATYQHDAVSTVGTLRHGRHAPRSSNRNLTVFGDYDNANFGVGNAFNARANVTGTGSHRRGGNAGQRAGADRRRPADGSSLTGGTTATPTLTIGNVHVGDNALRVPDRQHGNDRWAGAARRDPDHRRRRNITDPRLSGSGVTAANFGPIAPGGIAGFDVNFNARDRRRARAAHRPGGAHRQQLRQRRASRT